MTPFWQSKPPIYLGRARRESLHAQAPHRAGDGLVSGHRVNLLERYDYPAEAFEVTAARYAALPFARQTLANRVKAFARFNVLPLYPAHDLRGYARRMGFSAPEGAAPALDSPAWRKEHLAQMDEQGIGGAGRTAAEPGDPSTYRSTAAVPS